MNLGLPGMPELESWMDMDQSGDIIDVLFGCSAKLPKLMARPLSSYTRMI